MKDDEKSGGRLHPLNSQTLRYAQGDTTDFKKTKIPSLCRDGIDNPRYHPGSPPKHRGDAHQTPNIIGVFIEISFDDSGQAYSRLSLNYIVILSLAKNLGAGGNTLSSSLYQVLPFRFFRRRPGPPRSVGGSGVIFRGPDTSARTIPDSLGAGRSRTLLRQRSA